jgi:hypothetical protein
VAGPSKFTRTALIAGGIVAGLAAAEVGLRLYAQISDRSTRDLGESLEASRDAAPGASTHNSLRGLVQPSLQPELIFELKPNLDTTFQGAALRTNSLGMRDREYRPDNIEGSLRIAGLGDSVMFGWGVEEEDGFLRLIEHRLRVASPPGARCEVLNFAVPGYNTVMQVAAFRVKALPFAPDAVILQFTNNDLDLPRFMLAQPDFWVFDRIWLMELVRGGLRGVVGSGGEWVTPGDVGDLDERDRRRVLDEYVHLTGADAARGAMAELAELTLSESIPVFFVVLQTSGEPWSEVVPEARELGFHVVEVGPLHTGYIRTHGIEPTDRGYIRTFWRSTKDPHPNELSHRLHAEAIAAAMVNEGLADGSS